MKRTDYDYLLVKAQKNLTDYLDPDRWGRREASPLVTNPPSIGLVLGTGWGDTVALEEATPSIPLSHLSGFETLEEVPGHARSITVGTLADRRVAVLSGRVHMNETTFNPEYGPAMVRMQIELLLKLGVKTLVLTAAVGGLTPAPAVSHVGAITGLVTTCAGPMPMFGGEFVSPEDLLDTDLINLAMSCRRPELNVSPATHVFVRGPFFEGRDFDKNILRQLGPNQSGARVFLPMDNRVVGMSILPELCVAALHKDVRALALGYVTNGPAEEHSLEANVAAARSKGKLLGDLLRDIVRGIV